MGRIKTKHRPELVKIDKDGELITIEDFIKKINKSPIGMRNIGWFQLACDEGMEGSGWNTRYFNEILKNNKWATHVVWFKY